MITRDLLMDRRPLATAAAAVYPYDSALERRYRRTTRFGEEYSFAQQAGSYLLLPRAICPLGEADNRSLGVPVNLTFRGAPRNTEQERVWTATADFLADGKSGIVEAPTGSGKTVLGCYAAAAVGRRTLVVVTKEDLYDQWINSAQTFLGLTRGEVGLVQGDVCQVDRPIALAMIHTLALTDRYTAKTFDGFGLVIFDEVHRLGATEFVKATYRLNAALRLGLSATPNRSDGKEDLIQAHIGPIRVRSTVQQLRPKVIQIWTDWKVPRVRRNGQFVRMPHQAGKLGLVYKFMAEDNGRNAIMADVIAEAYAKGRKTVFFSDLLAHLDTMRSALVARGVPQTAMRNFVGGLSTAEREAAKQAPILLATYKMMGEGTDIPSLDTAVFGTPRSDIVQIAGRILRVHAGKQQPVIIDLIDKDSGVLLGYADKRHHWYQSIGAEIVRVN